MCLSFVCRGSALLLVVASHTPYLSPGSRFRVGFVPASASAPRPGSRHVSHGEREFGRVEHAWQLEV